METLERGRPKVGQCPVCDSFFDHPVRAQGGGARKKYCSARCRSLDWVRGNGGTRQASVVKYDEKHVVDKRERARRTLLKKRGWSEVDFERQLARQSHLCYGCLRLLTRETARIDHDHETGKVRGLLCDSCNWALGHVKDSPSTLRRLMAYLDHRIDKTNIYVIGALKNPRIPEIGNTLRQDGYDVMDEWFTPGEHADTNWQKYEGQRGRSYIEALRGRAATNIFLFDRSYLDHCDVALLVLPAGKSGMLELGYARGRGKKTIIFLDGQDPDRYDIMPNFAHFLCKTEEELRETLRNQ